MSRPSWRPACTIRAGASPAPAGSAQLPGMPGVNYTSALTTITPVHRSPSPDLGEPDQPELQPAHGRVRPDALLLAVVHRSQLAKRRLTVRPVNLFGSAKVLEGLGIRAGGPGFSELCSSWTQRVVEPSLLVRRVARRYEPRVWNQRLGLPTPPVLRRVPMHFVVCTYPRPGDVAPNQQLAFSNPVHDGSQLSNAGESDSRDRAGAVGDEVAAVVAVAQGPLHRMAVLQHVGAMVAEKHRPVGRFRPAATSSRVGVRSGQACRPAGAPRGRRGG